MNYNSTIVYQEVKEKTGLQEYHAASIQGMECFFCEKESTKELFVLIFQGDTRLKDLVVSKEPLDWKQFRYDVSETAQMYAPNDNAVCFIYMMDEHSEGIPIQMIEGDRSKGRKYVFFMEEAVTFLNGVSRIDTSEAEASDPVKVWASILGQEHLTACMTEPYYKKNVVSYLDGNDFDADELYGDTEKETDNCIIPQIKWVDSLDTTGFREFCFDDERLDFGQINLLYGANGSGKTSVLEGIEYAMTAEIRRMKDFKVKLSADRYPRVRLTTKAGNHVSFYPEFAAKKSKDIEKVWYGVPSGRARSTLNANFSRFNEFDAEAAYKFVHETDSSEASFSSMFGNLMFGEEIVDYEKKWQRYKKAFDELSTEIRDELASARWNVQYYTEELQRRDSENHSQEIENLLRKLKFLKTNSIPKGRTERYGKLVEQLEIARKYADELIKLWGVRGGNFDSIRKYIDDINHQESIALLRRDESQKKVQNLLAQIDEAKEVLYQSESESRTQEKLIRLYTAKKDEWRAIKKILEDAVSIALYNQLQVTLQETEIQVSEIQKIERFPKAVKYLADGAPMGMSKDEIEQLSKTVRDLQQKKLSLEKAYREKTRLLNAEKDRIAELKKLGKQLVHSEHCPLCGAQHSNISELLSAIDSATAVDTELDEIVTELSLVEKELTEKTHVLNYEHEKEAARKEIESLIENSAYLMRYKNDIDGISSFVRSKETLDLKLKEIQAQMDVLKKQGITQQSIDTAEKFKKTDEIYRTFMATEEISFDRYLDDCITSCVEKKDKADSTCEEIHASNENLECQIMHVRETIRAIDEGVSKNSRELAGNIQQVLNMLERFFTLPNGDEINQWMTEFKLLAELAESEKKNIADEGMVEYEKQELKESQEKVERLAPQSERCLRAVMAFEKMPSLTSFVENSIKNNIDVISQYFKWMHHSGEFSELSVDQTGLYAVRSMNNQIVRPYEMSTGQRSAIALSVMLALYSAAKTAPRFLLFDEPLATMDDIQVMNILDILKTLVAQGTQIFFTTANDEMIRHFKESFGGTSYTYREYFFTKRINGKSLIQERHIEDALPNEEISQ